MIKIKTNIYIVMGMSLLPTLFYSCKSSRDTMTRHLFMQSREVTIELPPREDILAGEGGSINFTLDEHVEFENENTLDDMQYLDNVVVTAHYLQRFTPERDGLVNVDFIVRVPKEFVSPEWRLSLIPKLMTEDTIVALDLVILKGERFQEKQQADKDAYDNYLASIIREEEYDDMFLNRNGIARDMYRRQQFYYQLYHKRFKEIENYYNFRRMMEDRYAKANTLKDGRREGLYHNYMLKGNEQAIRLWATGRDSTGTVAKYERAFRRKANFLPQYKLTREVTVNSFPKKYRDLFLEDVDLHSIRNLNTTAQDSIQIARHHYLFGAIAENEMKDRRRQEMEKRMIPFPVEENPRFIAVGERTTDFIYYYSQPWPVTVGLGKIRICVEGKVDAIDLSSFTLPKTDTLTYLISSLAELVDTTLTEKKTKIYRNMIARETIYPKFAPNRTEFNIREGNNRKEIDDLLTFYRRFTEERGLQMDSIRITATTAPDGSYNNNLKLSKGRVEAFSGYLEKNHSGIFPGDKIKVNHRGEDWTTWIDQVGKRTDLPNKQQILSILSAGRRNPDETEQEIKRIYRTDYNIMYDSIYPKLSKMDLILFLSRPGMNEEETILIETKEGYKEGLELLKERKYEEALQILGQYPDYNTALCLTALGYHGKAYDILKREDENGNTQYLLAIVSSRLGRSLEAKDYLIKALELEPAKALRAVIDAETASLIYSYNLQDKIREAEWRWLYDDIPVITPLAKTKIREAEEA